MKKLVTMSIINLGMFALANMPFAHASQHLCPKETFAPADIRNWPQGTSKTFTSRTVGQVTCRMEGLSPELRLEDQTIDHFLLREDSKRAPSVVSSRPGLEIIQSHCGYDAIHTHQLSNIESARNRHEWVAIICTQRRLTDDPINPHSVGHHSVGHHSVGHHSHN